MRSVSSGKATCAESLVAAASNTATKHLMLNSTWLLLFRFLVETVQKRRRILQRVVGGHLKQRRERLGAAQVRHPVFGFAHARIAVFGEHRHLQLRREPALGDDLDGLLVAQLASRNRHCSS